MEAEVISASDKSYSIGIFDLALWLAHRTASPPSSRRICHQSKSLPGLNKGAGFDKRLHSAPTLASQTCSDA